jgi:hypothetical protein
MGKLMGKQRRTECLNKNGDGKEETKRTTAAVDTRKKGRRRGRKR